MRVAVEACLMGRHRTGIGCYTRALFGELLRQAPPDDIVFLSHDPASLSASVPGARAVPGAAWRSRHAWLHLLAPRTLRELRPSLVHFTGSIAPLAGVPPGVVTVYDMTPVLFPQLHPWRRRLSRLFVARSAKAARAVIVPSLCTRRDVIELLDIPPERVHVVHGAARPGFRPVEDAGLLDSVRRRYGLADRFLFYLGNLDPRKNLSRLLTAWARLKRSGLPHQLVLAGPAGWDYRRVRRAAERLGAAREVLFTGYVPEGDLPALFTLAETFIFPSLYEGFGLPVLEAMACGTPVITSLHSSLEEIARGAAELVDPLDTGRLERAIGRLADDRTRREELSLLGLRRSREFSWDRAARQTLALYREFG
jgi:glycosyltransferase involved in cell wall biosynthesis